MRPPLPRWLCAHLARALLHLARGLLPSRQADWARAMQAEVLAIEDAHEALRYAWGCFCAAVHLAADRATAQLREPDILGLACASLVVSLGCAFMATRDAPSGYAWVNGLSLALAWASFWLLPRARLQQDARWRAAATFGLGAALLWAAAPQPDGLAAAGWLRLGPLAVQPTWLLCPAWWVVSSPLATPTTLPLRALQLTGLAMGLLALAAQAQAPLLALTAVLLAVRSVRVRSVGLAALALLALALAAAALARWTAPPPSPYVDEVLQLAFMHGPALGGLMTAAWLTLLLPGLLHRRAREHGLAWAALLALALPGWLPAPVLGFGGSFIVGYALSLALLPKDRLTAPRQPRPSSASPPARNAAPLPRAGLA